MALKNKEIFSIADSDACNPDDRGWGPKFSALLFGKAIESAATAPLLEQIAQLEQQLAEARKPDMFWNHDDPERPHNSIDEFLNEEICNGCVEVGAVFKILRATTQPSVMIKVTAIDEEQCEATYEVFDAAIAQTNAKGGEA